MGYWLIVSVLGWGLLTLVGFYWRPLGPLSASTILIAMGIGVAWLYSVIAILLPGLFPPAFRSPDGAVAVYESIVELRESLDDLQFFRRA